MATTIRSEDPNSEQWTLLSQYSYPIHIRRYATAHGLSFSDDTLSYVAGSIRQSEAYFTAAKSSPLDISPLLLYYGATILLAGVRSLMTAQTPAAKHHGMRFFLPSGTSTRIADFRIRPVRESDGALQEFANVFGDGCVLPGLGDWTMLEIFSSIPDLRDEFERCYEPELTNFVPVETVTDKLGEIEFTYHRVRMNTLKRYGDPFKTLSSIVGARVNYIPFRINIPSEHANLYFREKQPSDSIYSISGQEYLPMNFEKNGQNIRPTQLILLVMGLFGLGFLSRYYPDRWNAFVRTDETGERLLIEKFMSNCHRQFPNLVLDAVRGERLQFAYLVSTD
ncbi:MAG: hypothetical protein DWQ47_16530 [Acidobacteria bacterium]|mgnify:CR=1 FL=1|nr:MAG: hypothetical protein DWQ32_03930 [Acidobacteriota bacterium]REK02344.1 MAG: hypothetical protein DWQ38_08210 [Acidobacteriota bacterium]REK13854.1 MAG: hypothetical protein DWQ43_09620 [Acidobacteriota bacterium]REK41849.1 MAG: hypothetical protein DWQ47_16530 [Acidobacteriota bacterium]